MDVVKKVKNITSIHYNIYPISTLTGTNAVTAAALTSAQGFINPDELSYSIGGGEFWTGYIYVYPYILYVHTTHK